MQHGFREKIRQIRERKELSLSQMATKIGMSKSTLHGYENGTRNPSLDVLAVMRGAYGVSLDYLFGFADKETVDISDLTDEQKEEIHMKAKIARKYNKMGKDIEL